MFCRPGVPIQNMKRTECLHFISDLGIACEEEFHSRYSIGETDTKTRISISINVVAQTLVIVNQSILNAPAKKETTCVLSKKTLNG